MRRIDAAIVTLVTLVLLVGLGAVAWKTVERAEGVLVPALEKKADAVALSVASLATEAVGYGIPVPRFVGAEAVLRAALDEDTELAFATILAADGTVTAEARREDDIGFARRGEADIATVTRAIEGADGAVGAVAVGIPRAVEARVLRDLAIDISVLLLVAILVALELTAFAFALPSAARLRGITTRLSAARAGRFDVPPGASDPALAAMDRAVDARRARLAALRERAAGDGGAQKALETIDARHHLSERPAGAVNLAVVRAPVFLFFFAEEMTRPFLPTSIASLAGPVPGLSPEVVIALPIALFMAIVALSQPFLNGVTERAGRGRALRIGALVAALGYGWASSAGSLIDFTLARCVTAFGFATVFIAAQGFVVDRTAAGGRARGIGLFVSAIMAAMLCGPPIGGIIADRLGEATAFQVSAVMALVAALCAFVALPRTEGVTRTARGTVRFGDLPKLLARPAMALLLIGTAVPAKVLLIGLCMYLLPLELAKSFEPAVIGRVLMLYGLAMLVTVPLVSRLSDKQGLRVPFVVGGGVAAGASVLHLVLWPEPWGAALMVLQIGVAQGLSTTPQSALVGDLGRQAVPDLSEGALYGIFRLVERLGTVVGPLLVGFVWTMTSAMHAAFVTGGLVIFGALAFFVAAMASGDGALRLKSAGRTP